MSLAAELFPLYLVIAAGFVLGKIMKIDAKTISGVLVYVIVPATVFYGVAVAPHNDAYLALPALYFGASVIMSALFYGIGRIFWTGSEKNLLSAAAGSGNTGFFGLPMVLIIAGQEGLSIVAFIIMGGALYQSTCGYYIIARGSLDARDAVMRVVKLPMLYAFFAGLLVNRSGYPIPASALELLNDVKGTYVVLGMMVIGTVLAGADASAFDPLFTALAFAAKFVAFPLLIGAGVWYDTQVSQVFSDKVHTVLLLLSAVPMASLTINFAALLKAKPEKIAVTVTASTVFALVYIPVFVALVVPGVA